ncbi:MAG: DmsE family decaheme c-type cytochrome [Armatimonadota bacterium]
MNQKKLIFTALLSLTLGGLIFLIYPQEKGMAQKDTKYAGTETCAMCHAEISKKWQLTVHRRTLFNKDASKQGCEACHGPGADHAAGGGDKSKIIRFETLSPKESSRICKSCHTQAETTLWDTSMHARSKVSCVQCHDPHSMGEKDLLADVDNAKTSIEGLARALKQAELQSNTADKDGSDKEKAEAEVKRLKAERIKLQEQLEKSESLYQRNAEPYVCYSCHKAQQMQSKLPSHHPIAEGKVKCSSCHNPHGGPNGMLKAESVVETCARCHADKVGPFTFQHPPVTEDCTICHTPHGSVQRKLLVRSQSFICLKCHASPHNIRGDKARFASYFGNCTDCHTQIHGSDQHGAMHF